MMRRSTSTTKSPSNSNTVSPRNVHWGARVDVMYRSYWPSAKCGFDPSASDAPAMTSVKPLICVS